MSWKFISLTILFVSFLISCSEKVTEVLDSQLSTEQEQEKVQENISYLALGDSYTIGEGVEESLRWPNQLIEKLEENDYLVDRSSIIARTGWTTNNLLRAIGDAELEEYNLVSLLIGVNNQYQNQPIDVFQLEFNELLDLSIEIAGVKERVFVVSIPDYGVTPFGSSNRDRIAKELDDYNSYMREKCESQEIKFIDITEISRELGDSSGSLAPDGLHPSGTQYGLWVNKILPVVMEMLDSE